MKTFKLIIKIAAITAVICGVIFAVIYFREDLKRLCAKLRDKMKRQCPFCREDSDFDDI
jgi:hypothetical protein